VSRDLRWSSGVALLDRVRLGSKWTEWICLTYAAGLSNGCSWLHLARLYVCKGNNTPKEIKRIIIIKTNSQLNEMVESSLSTEYM
jgi:hypothetical protein